MGAEGENIVFFMDENEFAKVLQEEFKFKHRGRAFNEKGVNLDDYILIFDGPNSKRYNGGFQCYYAFVENKKGSMVSDSVERKTGLLDEYNQKYKYMYEDVYGKKIYIE